MKMKYSRVNQNRLNSLKKISEIKIKTENNITEKDLINTIEQLVEEYKKRGYTDEQLLQMTFYRYKTKKS